MGTVGPNIDNWKFFKKELDDSPFLTPGILFSAKYKISCFETEELYNYKERAARPLPSGRTLEHLL